MIDKQSSAKNLLNHFPKLILLAIIYLCFTYRANIFAESSDSKTQNPQGGQIEKTEEEKELYISPAILPSPEEYAIPPSKEFQKIDQVVCGNHVQEGSEECDDGNIKDGDGCNSLCLKENTEMKPVCGNGKTEEGEQCGEPGLSNCAQGKNCESCVCVTSHAAICGNGQVESGEECGEAGLECQAGLRCSNCQCVSGERQCDQIQCPEGEHLNTDTCACVPDGASPPRPVPRETCGNGTVEESENCGEPGLSGCQSEENCIDCECVPIECGYVSCPAEMRCQVPYCTGEAGDCVWGNRSLKNGQEITPEKFDSGVIDVDECCAQIHYESFVNYDPCTGRPIESSYEVRMTGIDRMGGEQCYCPILEPTPATGREPVYVNRNGQVVGCGEAVDPAKPPRVTFLSGEAQPRIRIECFNCCGDLKRIDKTLNQAQTKAPAECGELVCPAAR